MKCPIDNTELVMSERQGIEIDYCPACRGVWLDRGELDKIIERSAPTPPAAQQRHEPQPREYGDRDSYRGGDRDSYRGDDHDPRYKKKRRESFLSDIFDF